MHSHKTIYNHKRGMRQRDASVAAERAPDVVRGERSPRPQLRKSRSDRRFKSHILWLNIAPMYNHKTVPCRKRGLRLKARKSARWSTEQQLFNDLTTRLLWRPPHGFRGQAMGRLRSWPVMTSVCAPIWAPWEVAPSVGHHACISTPILTSLALSPFMLALSSLREDAACAFASHGRS